MCSLPCTQARSKPLLCSACNHHATLPAAGGWNLSNTLLQELYAEATAELDKKLSTAEDNSVTLTLDGYVGKVHAHAAAGGVRALCGGCTQ